MTALFLDRDSHVLSSYMDIGSIYRRRMDMDHEATLKANGWRHFINGEWWRTGKEKYIATWGRWEG